MVENDNLAQQMELLADKAVTLARDQFDVDFDFTEYSLRLVEKILAKMGEDIPKSILGRIFKRGPSKNQINSVCMLLGAYIGEVMRRKWNGTWHLDSTFGEPLPAIAILDGKIYPTHKVYKRLVDGEGDNIWAYYEMLENMVEQGTRDGGA